MKKLRLSLTLDRGLAIRQAGMAVFRGHLAFAVCVAVLIGIGVGQIEAILSDYNNP